MKKSEDKEIKIPGVYQKIADNHFKIVSLEEKADKLVGSAGDIQIRGSKLTIEFIGKHGHFLGIMEKDGEIKWEEYKKNKTPSGFDASLENSESRTIDSREDENAKLEIKSEPKLKTKIKRARRKK